MIKVHNIRAGFATNSSSSHSVVIIPANKINTVSERPNSDVRYGWDNFILTSVDEKMKYFAVQLYSSLRYTLDKDVVIQLVRDITDIDLNEYAEESSKGKKYIDAYVDHQSVWCISSLDITSNDYKAFLYDLRDYLMKDEIIIAGGNDNSDGNPYMPKFGSEDHIIIDTIGVNYSLSKKIIRKDGDYYTFFSKSTGTKIRISLKDNVKPYRKSSTPELVDLKITQYCPYGCQFCYMGSTKVGVHAPFERIKTYIDMLADLKVMEIALGGGEPTTHPDFMKILEYIDSKGMVANFTTFSVEWLRNENIVKAVKKYVSAIGVSVLSKKDLNKVYKIKEILNKKIGSEYPETAILAQHVLGSTPENITCELLIEVWNKGINILLLGYKKVGFGKDYAPYPVDQILLLLKLSIIERKYYSSEVSFLAVDTAFVNKFRKFLKELNISNKLISSPEGKFSMYIDAVEKRCAPSSYCAAKKYSDMPETAIELGELYEKY